MLTFIVAIPVAASFQGRVFRSRGMMRALAKQVSPASARNELVAHGHTTTRAERLAAGAHGRSDATRQEVARYIGQISVELSTMARKSDLDLLAYFLEMAHEEARTQIRKLEQGHARKREERA